MQKKIIISILLGLLCFSIYSQDHLSVDIDNYVYQILENAEQRGLIRILPEAKPYTKSQVISILEKIKLKSSQLTDYEITIIDSYIDDFTNYPLGLKNGNVATENEMGSFALGITEESEFRSNLNNVTNSQMTNGLTLYGIGDVSTFMSYQIGLGLSFDRISPDFTYKSSIIDNVITYSELGTYIPYHYTKEWDGFHMDFKSNNNDGVGSYGFVFLLENEIVTSFYDNRLILKLGKTRKEWGKGDGSLYLSGTARPFEAFELIARPAEWLNYTHLVGSLGDWFSETGTSTEQKMYTLQSLELIPTDWLYLAAQGSVIWGKRFEIGYLSPLMPGVFYQNLQGDFDNVGFSISAAGVIPYVGTLRGAFFIDEFRPNKSLTDARNIYSFQLGWDFPIPKLPFATFTFQYTKLEPFVYAHYPEGDYPFMSDSVEVSMSYTNDGENLAYYLPPNSDEFLFKIQTIPHPQVTASLAYKLIRHGTNSRDVNGDMIGGFYYGEMTGYLDYATYDLYGQKDFLNDGIYDWTNAITIEASYAFDNFPLELYASYGFSYTFWDANSTGLTAPDPVIQNIFVMGFKFFN